MDMEKVIKGLGYCANESKCAGTDCPYWESNDCSTEIMRDALALLKEQEPVVRCKDCRYGQYCTDGETTYQCFKWNSNEFGALHEQDWFCADGERA